MEQENKNYRQIDLLALIRDCFREARRLWILGVVLAAVVSGVLCGYRYLTYSPQYQAYASFTVKVANPLFASVNAYNTETAEQMAATFPSVLATGVLQQRVRSHLGISYIPSISATVLQSSNIFTLRVTDGDPELAYRVLRAVMEYYPEIAEFVVGPTVL